MAVATRQEINDLKDRRDREDLRPERRLLVGYLHKTSNTLCGIKGYASLIADRDRLGGEAGLWARKIIREVERMEEIFRSVGELTRGRGNPDTGVSLPALVGEVTSGWAGPKTGLDLVQESIPEAELKLPAADLALMLEEILKNCAESAGSGDELVRVEISGVELPDGQVYLEICDAGCGMEADLAAKAAEPFVTTKNGRIGIGLTRVDTLMDMYGLSWSLTSEEGKGTRVLMEVAEAFRVPVPGDAGLRT